MTTRIKASRKASALAARISQEIANGLSAGDLLDSERALARKHSLSVGTVRRALRVLVAEGLLQIEGRRGYRVLTRPNEPSRESLAYVSCSRPWPGLAQFRDSLLEAMQEAVGRRGWSLLALKGDDGRAKEAARHIADVRASGIIVDTADPAILDELHSLGIPIVVIDAWHLDCRFDAVVQDGFGGGILASAWLAQRGHQRVGYVGIDPRNSSLQIIERQSGAWGGLARQGLKLEPQDTIIVPEGQAEEALLQTRALLSRPDRPTAIIALWQYLALAVAQAAKELSLTLGRDLDLVGWSVSQGPGAETLMRLSGMGDTAAVTWNPAEMAELSIQRLIQRRLHPAMPTSSTRLPVRLWTPTAMIPGGRLVDAPAAR